MQREARLNIATDAYSMSRMCLTFPGGRTNASRVREADALVMMFHAMTGVDPAPDADGPDTALGDMLAHLMHWAEAKGIDFDDCLRSGRMHYDAETEEENPGAEDIPQYVREHEAEQARITEEWEAKNV